VRGRFGPPKLGWSRRVAIVGVGIILREAIQPDLEKLGLGDLDAQSFQSCLCEYNRYEKIRLREEFKPS
jgi:hypothetical protein